MRESERGGYRVLARARARKRRAHAHCTMAGCEPCWSTAFAKSLMKKGTVSGLLGYPCRESGEDRWSG
jgi:hypothetical protein